MLAGPDGKSSGESNKPEAGQVVELKFRAPRQGKYDLTLYILSGQIPAEN